METGAADGAGKRLPELIVGNVEADVGVSTKLGQRVQDLSVASCRYKAGGSEKLRYSYGEPPGDSRRAENQHAFTMKQLAAEGEGKPRGYSRIREGGGYLVIDVLG